MLTGNRGGSHTAWFLTSRNPWLVCLVPKRVVCAMICSETLTKKRIRTKSLIAAHSLPCPLGGFHFFILFSLNLCLALWFAELSVSSEEVTCQRTYGIVSSKSSYIVISDCWMNIELSSLWGFVSKQEIGLKIVKREQAVTFNLQLLLFSSHKLSNPLIH